MNVSVILDGKVYRLIHSKPRIKVYDIFRKCYIVKRDKDIVLFPKDPNDFSDGDVGKLRYIDGATCDMVIDDNKQLPCLGYCDGEVKQYIYDIDKQYSLLIDERVYGVMSILYKKQISDDMMVLSDRCLSKAMNCWEYSKDYNIYVIIRNSDIIELKKPVSYELFMEAAKNNLLEFLITLANCGLRYLGSIDLEKFLIGRSNRSLQSVYEKFQRPDVQETILSGFSLIRREFERARRYVEQVEKLELDKRLYIEVYKDWIILKYGAEWISFGAPCKNYSDIEKFPEFIQKVWRKYPLVEFKRLTKPGLESWARIIKSAEIIDRS